MKFSTLKSKFRRGALTVMFMLSAMTGCRSPAPQQELAPEKQKTEWAINPAETSANGAGQDDAYAEAKHSGDAPALKEPPPAKATDPAPAGGAGIDAGSLFSKKTATPLFPGKSFSSGLTFNYTYPPSQPSFMYKKDVLNFVQNKDRAYMPIRADLLKLPRQSSHAWDWQVRVYASHAFTHYFPSDIKIKTSRYNVRIENYEWAERGSRDFFKPETWAKPGNNPLQIFDEPTNTYAVAFEKNAHVLFVSAFHPKFLQDPDQVRHIQGTIDGVEVDHTAPVNDDLHGNYYLPGAMRLEDNKNTYLQMEFEAGYAHKFNLLSSRKFGTVSYVPGLSAGVQAGRTRSAVVKDGERTEYNEQYALQGYGGSVRNKLEWRTPKERFGLFYENKFSLYHRKHALLDGTQEFDFAYMSNSVGFSFSLYNPANHRKSNFGCP